MSILNCLQKVRAFVQVSGLKLNKDKTEGLWLGRHVNRKDTFGGITGIILLLRHWVCILHMMKKNRKIKI